VTPERQRYQVVGEGYWLSTIELDDHGFQDPDRHPPFQKPRGNRKYISIDSGLIIHNSSCYKLAQGAGGYRSVVIPDNDHVDLPDDRIPLGAPGRGDHHLGLWHQGDAMQG